MGEKKKQHQKIILAFRVCQSSPLYTDDILLFVGLQLWLWPLTICSGVSGLSSLKWQWKCSFEAQGWKWRLGGEIKTLLSLWNVTTLEAGRVEESPGQDPRPLICARTFTNRSYLSFVISEWKTCLIGSKVRRQSQKIWWSYGDLRGFRPLYLCLVKQHLTSVIIWLSYFYQEPHHQQTPVTKF